MQWVNHKITGFGVPFTIFGDPVFAIASGFSSLLPDVIEGKRKILKHRGISHNPFAWLILLAAIYLFILIYAHTSEIPLALLTWIIGAITTGVAMHLVTDILTITGIPFRIKNSDKPQNRIAFKLFRSGSPIEYTISSVILLLSLAVHYRSLLSPAFYQSLFNKYSTLIYF